MGVLSLYLLSLGSVINAKNHAPVTSSKLSFPESEADLVTNKLEENEQLRQTIERLVQENERLFNERTALSKEYQDLEEVVAKRTEECDQLRVENRRLREQIGERFTLKKQATKRRLEYPPESQDRQQRKRLSAKELLERAVSGTVSESVCD